MALITVSGTALPTPTEFQVGVQDISRAERNANGKMKIERIAVKIKLFVNYAYLTASDASKVLKLISPTTYSITYLDPQTNSMKTGSFYCGDRQLGLISYHDGVPVYKDFSVNFIEL